MHPEEPPIVLEEALAGTNRDAERAAAAARKLNSAVAAARRAAETGDLKALRRSFDTAREAAARAVEEVEALERGWKLSEEDEEAHLASEAYLRELVEAAERAGLSLYEQDGGLACYPSLVQVQASKRQLRIDRKAFRHLRPTRVVAYLEKLQKSPPKLNVERFLGMLQEAYLVRTGGEYGRLERLLDLYRTLTLHPTARADYSQQEFARDIYLLDGSGLSHAKDGTRFRLDLGATAARRRSKLLVVVTREGVERTYFGIEFLGKG